MCGYCPGATIGEAKAFYKAVRTGTVTEQMAQKMADHSARMGLPERQRAELLEDPELFAGQPAFKLAVEELLARWDENHAHENEESFWGDLAEFESSLVDLREQYDEVYEGIDFDSLVAAAPQASRDVLARVPVHA